MFSISLCVFTAALLVFGGSQPGHDPFFTPVSGFQQNSSQPSAEPSPAQSQTEANRRIHDSISDLLSSDPVLSGSDVDATVDDHSITLTGKVDSYVQHQRVLQLVSSYGCWRKIVDKMEMK
jgi:osmotically-inducible protein OsmY